MYHNTTKVKRINRGYLFCSVTLFFLTYVFSKYQTKVAVAAQRSDKPYFRHVQVDTSDIQIAHLFTTCNNHDNIKLRKFK